MRLLLTGRQVEITPAASETRRRGSPRLERRLNDSAVSAQLVLARHKYRYVVELAVHARGDHMLHGVGSTAGWSTSLTSAVGKVMQQAQKVKGKWAKRGG